MPIIASRAASSARSFGEMSFVKPRQFRYFIFDPIRVKSPGNYIQLSEFNLMNGGSRITSATYNNWNGSFSPGGHVGSSNSPGNETPSLANDGSTGTKWLDFRESGGGIYIDLGSVVNTTGYQMYTANDASGRDPYTWDIYGSVDNTTWYLISRIVNYYGTDSRFAYYGGWNWDFTLS